MTTDNRDQTSAQSAFIAFQALSKQWYDKEREGIALIEQFQSALLSCQESMSIDNEVTPRGTALSMASFCERKDHNATNAWRLEDIYSQVKAMKSPFVELLEEMYALYYTVRTNIREKATESFSIIEYSQWMLTELSTFEAEYQHIEILLAMISFDMTADQLRTLVISWSTSPFLNLTQSRDFRQRHKELQAEA